MDHLDLDRGMTQRSLPNSGPLISMYKDDPGVYYDMKGRVVEESVAASAGFAVDVHRIEREKKRRLAEMKDELDERFSKEETAIERQLSEESERARLEDWEGEGPNRIVKRNEKGEPRETERLRMDHKGRALWNVVDKADGKVLLTRVEKAEAHELLKKGV